MSLLTSKNEKARFLDEVKAAREGRQQAKLKEKAALVIQTRARGYLARKKFQSSIRQELDQVLGLDGEQESDVYKPILKPASDAFRAAWRYLAFVYKADSRGLGLPAAMRLDCLCKYIIHSLEAESTKMNYLSVLMVKDTSLRWIEHVKRTCTLSCEQLRRLKPELHTDNRRIALHLHVLVAMTSTNTWRLLQGKAGEALRPGMNKLCNNIMGSLVSGGALYSSLKELLTRGIGQDNPTLKSANLAAVATIALRPVMAADFSDNLLRELTINVLAVPAFVYHLNLLASEVMSQYVAARIFKKVMSFLGNDENLIPIMTSLEGSGTLYLLANLIQLGTTEMEGILDNPKSFVATSTNMLLVVGLHANKKKSSKTHWHPVLGWTAERFTASTAVPQQLQVLWHGSTLRLVFSDLFDYFDAVKDGQTSAQQAEASAGASKSSAVGLLKKKADKKASSRLPLNSPIVQGTSVACGMYKTAGEALTQMKVDMLAGLSSYRLLPHYLWACLSGVLPSSSPVRSLLDILGASGRLYQHPLFDLLILFCDATSQLVSIMDEVELYDEQKLFTLDELASISSLLNQFCFSIIWYECIDCTVVMEVPLFRSAHSLLMHLYERDCRRSFTSADHWLVKDVKPLQFLAAVEKQSKTALFLLRHMPHIIPHRDRVVLFRKLVGAEKEALGIKESQHHTPHSTFITVHRSRMLEDGYTQLAALPSLALKGIIRVKFVNEQGLDEAGIDQDGVFKEFLEETIRRVFDPSLSLFKATSEQRLYPSPTSFVQENHLQLFEFVGKMLAKALYEGIVVDVVFASFFLTQVLGNASSNTYSFLDELPSLDPALYKSLAYVKHYDGDVGDIDLTFSHDEECLGKIENYELVPGGRAMSVTNENRISYVHYMARFKMHTQIKEQTAAFIRGFRSIVNKDWLDMFSTPELQKLISGDTIDIDLEDLRRHTQYYGGFHSSHKVIKWLWDVLENDFTAKERGQFLKFVTSCSKPPLLGFVNLEPPFSIRCVEVSDDLDYGDTLGSVIKGFFNIKTRGREPAGRLPTSSTCFNLLKLPNYPKKSVLREKLRYAMASNAGFELS